MLSKPDWLVLLDGYGHGILLQLRAVLDGDLSIGACGETRQCTFKRFSYDFPFGQWRIGNRKRFLW